MAAREVDHLLIGGGIASAECARALRENGAGGRVLVVGREPLPPYHRPPASKGYLRGLEAKEDTYVHPESWWRENDVELMTRTSVAALDTEARVATIGQGEKIAYGSALVATGAMVRRLRCEGAGLDGIHYLRALANADTIARATQDAERVVMIGGSYIGCEVVASLTEMGRRCTIVMQESVTLERGFGRQVGRHVQDLLEAHGIDVVGDDEVERFTGPAGEGGEPGAVSAVVTKAGRELAADAVVAGVGALPDVMLARKAGLELGHSGGVRCDRYLETSAPGVYSAGDMCEYDSVLHGGPLRIEHEDVAATQGRTAGLNMLGAGRSYDTVPYFFCHLSDWASLEYVGPALTWDEEIVRGSIAGGAFSVWYLEHGAVRAVLSVGRPEDLDHGRSLIRSGEMLGDRGALADASKPLPSGGPNAIAAS